MGHPSILTRDLYETALLAPLRKGAKRLLVVSGYATPAMVSRFLADVNEKLQVDVTLELVVGMAGQEGVWVRDHEGYLALQDQPPTGIFKVAYTTGGRSVHTKLYVWMNDDTPVEAFVGSANFTQNGFLIGWRRGLHSEILAPVDPSQAYEVFCGLEAESVYASHPDVEAEVELRSRARPLATPVATADDLEEEELLQGVDSVVLPLVALKSNNQTGTVRGEPHRRWGLNWGQRDGRDRNQAVIPVPQKIWETSPDFFPKGVPGNRPQFQVTRVWCMKR